MELKQYGVAVWSWGGPTFSFLVPCKSCPLPFCCDQPKELDIPAKTFSVLPTLCNGTKVLSQQYWKCFGSRTCTDLVQKCVTGKWNSSVIMKWKDQWCNMCLCELLWLSVCFPVQFKVLVIVYIGLCGMGPGYLRNRLTPVGSAYPTRAGRRSMLRPCQARNFWLAGSRRSPAHWNNLALMWKPSPAGWPGACTGACHLGGGSCII